MVNKVVIRKDQFGSVNAKVNGVEFHIIQHRMNPGQNGYEGFTVCRYTAKGNRAPMKDFDTMEELREYLKNI